MTAERSRRAAALLLCVLVALPVSKGVAASAPAVHRPGKDVECACRVTSQGGVRVLRPDRDTLAGRKGGAENHGEAEAGAEQNGPKLDLSAPSEKIVLQAAEMVGSRYDRLLASIWRSYGARIRAAAARHRLPEDLVLAVIAVESAGKRSAHSPAGAQGLMQLMPQTAALSA